MKMIFISNNNYIQKFLFNNLGNMVYTEPCVIYNGFRSYGLSELWVVGVMGRRKRDLTPRARSVK